MLGLEAQPDDNGFLSLIEQIQEGRVLKLKSCNEHPTIHHTVAPLEIQ